MNGLEQARFAALHQQANILSIEASLRIQQANTAKHMENPHGAEVYEQEAQALLNDAMAINKKLYRMDLGLDNQQDGGTE